MTAYDEEKLAELLRSLPPAPEGWVEAAQELPFLRAQLDDIVQRAEADAEFRQALMADLEAALAEAGYEPSDKLVRELRARLSSQ
jgi:type VI protein secretion system component VasF